MPRKEGYFYYFDPPYIPVNETSSFVGYTSNGFKDTDQRRLRELCDSIVDKGGYVMVSNSDTVATFDLWDDTRYRLERVDVLRPINTDTTKRSGHTEIVITSRNYTRRIDNEN